MSLSLTDVRLQVLRKPNEDTVLVMVWRGAVVVSQVELSLESFARAVMDQTAVQAVQIEERG